MFDMLKNWSGAVEVNGVMYDDIASAAQANKEKLCDGFIIKLFPKQMEEKTKCDIENDVVQYCITVKPYMTKTATSDFDFMAKWNQNNPMPMRTMVGWIEKQTKGMVYMHLHGQEKSVDVTWEGWIIKSAIIKQDEWENETI